MPKWISSGSSAPTSLRKTRIAFTPAPASRPRSRFHRHRAEATDDLVSTWRNRRSRPSPPGRGCCKPTRRSSREDLRVGPGLDVPITGRRTRATSGRKRAKRDGGETADRTSAAHGPPVPQSCLAATRQLTMSGVRSACGPGSGPEAIPAIAAPRRRDAGRQASAGFDRARVTRCGLRPPAPRLRGRGPALAHVGALPGEGLLGAPEMPVGGGRAEDRPPQPEVPDQALRVRSKCLRTRS